MLKYIHNLITFRKQYMKVSIKNVLSRSGFEPLPAPDLDNFSDFNQLKTHTID